MNKRKGPKSTIMFYIHKEILWEILFMFEGSITVYAILSWWIEYICSINHTKWLSVIWWRSLLHLFLHLHLLSLTLLVEHDFATIIPCAEIHEIIVWAYKHGPLYPQRWQPMVAIKFSKKQETWFFHVAAIWYFSTLWHWDYHSFVLYILLNCFLVND